MKKRALVFGASGQVGQYLVALLKSKGYDVFCAVRPRFEQRAKQLYGCDLERRSDIVRAIINSMPDEVYNLAAKMFTPDSWTTVDSYLKVNTVAVGIMLEVLRTFPNVKFFQASSADVFAPDCIPMSEESPKIPVNPYGISKLAAQELVRIYRDKKGMFACSGILFNMESPLRSERFFTSKVCNGVARIKTAVDNGLIPARLELGDLSAKRDWGYTKEYVEAMHLMLQSPIPTDYVIGSGCMISCYDFVNEAFRYVGLDINDWCVYKSSDSPSNNSMLADSGKIRLELNWKANTTWIELNHILVDEAMKRVQSPVAR